MTEREILLGQTLCLLYLGIESFTDLRKGEISLLRSAAFAGIGIALSVLSGDFDWMSLATSLMPGAVIIVFAALTRGGMGIGDGIAILVMGCYFIFEDLLIVLMLAFCLAAIFGVGMLLRGKKRSDSFPFVPFLFMGQVVFLLLEICSSV